MTGEQKQQWVDLAGCCQGLFAKLFHCYKCYCINISAQCFSMELFRQNIQNLYENGDWRAVIKTLENEQQWFSHVLWVRPSEENLRFIANSVIENGLESIVSIGCGSGLLEWLIKSATGLKVVGLEVERKYWESYCRHNGPSYLPHIYPNDPEFKASSTAPRSALLFCYFNYRKPFDEYVCNYEGNCIIIIGPGPGRGTHTDPEPFNPRFTDGNWSLHSFQEIQDTKDFIAIYKRERNKNNHVSINID